MRAIAAAIFFLLPVEALAHSWYDKDCCDERDCRPATPEEVQVVPNGFTVRYKGMVRNFSRTEFRPSQDGRYHICVTPVIIRCLYVPGGTN